MLNDNYFDNINEPIKAYVLGLIIYKMKQNESDKIVLELNIENDNIIYNELSKISKLFNNKQNTFEASITSDVILKKIRYYYNFKSIYDYKISDIIDKITDKNSKEAFVKAYIECYGNIITENNENNLYITYYIEDNYNFIKNMFNIPCNFKNNFNLTTAIYNDVNIIDLMGIIYKDKIYINKDLYKWYINVTNNIECNYNTIKVFKSDSNAVLPSKNRISDAGYDITIIKEAKIFNDNTTLYDTGIKLNIPNGYYVEIVPRSSLSKSGYMLANSIGIIDQSYRGNIFIALTKINKSSDNIKLPFCCCQMIVKKQIYSDIVESFEDFSITNRNEAGYGNGSLKSIT